jgi:hypothetical protein
MDAQSYSLRREHNRWIVCAAGTELMACADKQMALRIIKAAAASKDDQAAPIPRRHVTDQRALPQLHRVPMTGALAHSRRRGSTEGTGVRAIKGTIRRGAK